MSATVLQFPTDRIARQSVRPDPVEPPKRDAECRYVDQDGNGVSDLMMAQWCKEVGWDVLTDNQRGFIAQLIDNPDDYPLSRKQAAWLDALVVKIKQKVLGQQG